MKVIDFIDGKKTTYKFDGDGPPPVGIIAGNHVIVSRRFIDHYAAFYAERDRLLGKVDEGNGDDAETAG